jgi:hypothetical protein
VSEYAFIVNPDVVGTLKNVPKQPFPVPAVHEFNVNVQVGAALKVPAVNVTAHPPEEMLPIVAIMLPDCEVIADPESQLSSVRSMRSAPLAADVTEPTRVGAFIAWSIAKIDHSSALVLAALAAIVTVLDAALVCRLKVTALVLVAL